MTLDIEAELAGQLIDEAPWLAEAWNQRAIAYFHLARYEDAANDCQQTLEMNPSISVPPSAGLIATWKRTIPTPR